MGFRDYTPLTSVSDSATKLYDVPTGREVRIKKLFAYNSSTSDVTVWLCDSGGTHVSPGIKVIAGQTVLLNERELPEIRYTSDVYAIASATGVEIQLEVEVI